MSPFRAFADVRLDTGGNIAVTARNLDVLAGSILVAGIRSGFGSPDSQAGDLILDATADIQVGQASGIGNLGVSVDLEQKVVLSLQS